MYNKKNEKKVQKQSYNKQNVYNNNKSKKDRNKTCTHKNKSKQKENVQKKQKKGVGVRGGLPNKNKKMLFDVIIIDGTLPYPVFPFI